MNRTILFSLFALSIFSATGASAAIFDSLESVDQLKVIAEQRTLKTDRMPAGKSTAPSKEDESIPSDETKSEN